MSRDLNINVNVNPNGVASPTQTRVTETPQSSEIKQRTARNGIATAAIISVAQRGLNLAMANVGEITGSRTLQRKLQFGSSLATFGIAAMVNPYAAAALAATQLASKGVELAVRSRDTAAEIEYNQALRNTRHNNGR
jgi:hypothetical protein